MKHSTKFKLGMGISLVIGIIVGALLSIVTANYLLNKLEYSPEWYFGYITGVNYQVTNNIKHNVMTGDGEWVAGFELAKGVDNETE